MSATSAVPDSATLVPLGCVNTRLCEVGTGLGEWRLVNQSQFSSEGECGVAASCAMSVQCTEQEAAEGLTWVAGGSACADGVRVARARA
eukprot:1284697-Rhodomonas_salina.2